MTTRVSDIAVYKVNRYLCGDILTLMYGFTHTQLNEKSHVSGTIHRADL